jgi:hypothetical protein
MSELTQTIKWNCKNRFCNETLEDINSSELEGRIDEHLIMVHQFTPLLFTIEEYIVIGAAA